MLVLPARAKSALHSAVPHRTAGLCSARAPGSGAASKILFTSLECMPLVVEALLEHRHLRRRGPASRPGATCTRHAQRAWRNSTKPVKAASLPSQLALPVQVAFTDANLPPGMADGPLHRTSATGSCPPTSMTLVSRSPSHFVTWRITAASQHAPQVHSPSVGGAEAAEAVERRINSGGRERCV